MAGSSSKQVVKPKATKVNKSAKSSSNVSKKPKQQSEQTGEADPVVKATKKTPTNQNAQFPFKLHQLLQEAEQSGQGDIVSWVNDNAFKGML